MKPTQVLLRLIKVAAEPPSALLDSYGYEPPNATPGVRVPRASSWPLGQPGRLTTAIRPKPEPQPTGQVAGWADIQASQRLLGVVPTPLDRVPRQSGDWGYLPGVPSRGGAGMLRVPLVADRPSLLHEATHAGQEAPDMVARYRENRMPFETAAMASEVKELMRGGASDEQLRQLSSNNAAVPGWVYQKIRQYGPKFDGTPGDLARAQAFGRELSSTATPLGSTYQMFVHQNGGAPLPANQVPPSPHGTPQR